MRKRVYFFVCFIMGILLCLVGALLMVAGEPLLGEDHSGIATIVGIFGIGTIGLSGMIASSIAERRS